ncbi:hypothetical protein RRU01S_04_01580 [Agrobacterium rubi TR3 = NBRC 13261]|uniref:Uncharacterized protein n=1 Tax=Agrobacterium rubi TR3 = NBRC 13261 TaxID=1368415 RepID=A0A081CRP0_9HYPH|nr:hypothetical protein [Agrobacterium rubi]MBP1876855.1 hypothetical protein [Agrobacterium rubi]MCL6651048.1 hypothetical protein [Agrobacterium rubi]GAK69336.1 hypothetical protein RRU01S_04_01580 [Agrobacterium rubi TR3 = NBRC 13261]
MKLKSLLSFFRKPSCQKPLPIRKDSALRCKILHRLITTDWIDVNTIQRFGTNAASARISDLRKEGILYAADDPKGFEWHKNAKGVGRHKRYRWTGKLPPNWVKTETFTGRERRKKSRTK